MHPSPFDRAPTRSLPGILVADDEQAVRDVLRRALSRHGFAVWLAQDGVEAVSVHAEHRGQIGLLLFDVLMPRLRGPEAFETIRKTDPDVICCFMTGYSADLRDEDLLCRGARHVFAKPFNLVEVCQTLAALGSPSARCA